MLGQSRRRQEPIQTSQGSAHLGSRVVVDPPSVSATCGDIRPANRTDLAKNVLKRRFVEGCFLLRHVEPEIDDVHVSWSSGEVKAVDPWADDIGVRATIRVRLSEKSNSRGPVDVERPDLDVAHEGGIRVFGESSSRGQIGPGGQVRIDGRHSSSVE